MPLDAAATAIGNVAVVEFRELPHDPGDPMAALLAALPVVRVGAKGPEPVTDFRYTSHFATCPNAAAHRRR